MDAIEAIEVLVQFGFRQGVTTRVGDTARGVQDTFERVMHVEYDDSDAPRCAWIDSVDETHSCHVDLRKRSAVVSYGPKYFTRELGRVVDRAI